MKNFWNWISFAGIKRPVNVFNDRRKILLNQIYFIIISSFAFLSIQSIYLRWFSDLVFIAPTFILGTAGFLVNHSGHHRFSLIALLVMGPIFVSIMCFRLGYYGELHYGFIVTSIIPFIVCERKDFKMIIYGLLLNLLALVFVILAYRFVTPINPVEPRINYTNYSIISLLVILSSYYLYRASARAEDGLFYEKNKSEKLLLNILPTEIVKELKIHETAKPVHYDLVSVMFTDFKGFTRISELMSPEELVAELDKCFSYFDSLMEKYHLEKLKTIGDSYMCAGGIPQKNHTHPIDCVLAAMEIQAYMRRLKNDKLSKNEDYWELRLGIHTGPLVAGIIGDKKFSYDVWGDTVNIASRMESSGLVDKINISKSTYELISGLFECQSRGMVDAKNKGQIEMYLVNGIKMEYSTNGDGCTPNEAFWTVYKERNGS